MNTSICVRNVHNVSFTGISSKKSSQIVFYEWRQCKNVSHDQLTTVKCTPFGFWNTTSITIDRLDVLVYPQNKMSDCTLMLGMAFTNMFQLHLHHCNITLVRDPSFSFGNSIYLGDSQFVTVAFSNIICYEGRLHVKKSKNIEITNNTIVGGIEVHDSAIVTISYCNVSLVVERYIGTIYIIKSTNISLAGITLHSDNHGISIHHTNHTRLSNVTLFNCSRTGLDIVHSIDTGVVNTTIVFSTMAILITYSKHTSLQHVALWHNSFGISMRNVVKVNINNVFVSDSIYEVFSAEISISLSIKNLTAVNWTGSSFYLRHTDDVTLQNLTVKSGTVQTSQMEYSQGLIGLSHNITMENTLFSGSTSHSTTTDITRQPAVLEIYDSQVEMENCSFENNSITPLMLTKTLLSVSGNLNFTNNTAYRGGAIVFLYNNSLSLSENSRVTFVGNRAIHTGGAVYIVTNTVYNSGVFCTNCFLKLNKISKYEKQLIFTNNSAGQGGDVVYGGRMESTCPIYRTDFSFHHTYDHISCLSMFLEISVINPKSLSPISSEPSRVCFCNKRGISDCLPLYHHTVFSIYPGQKISISAVVVGQNFGTVAGSVFAQFLSSKRTPQLDVRESAQEVQHIHCNQLVYTIFSLIDREDNYRVLILTAVKRTITETNELELITKQIAYYENGWSDDIMDTPVYVRVNLMPCPPGFLLNASGPPKCDCNNQLRSLPDVACNIQYSTLQRRGLVWIGPLTDDNDTITDVMSSEYCPLNYCKDETVSFQLNASSAQCNYNHSDLVCGGCQPGLSLALGSAQCLKCSNTYLALLIPFALVGVVLVFFIKLLDLTVSLGLINGLIFYANIIKPSEYIFLPQRNTNPLTLFISWLNLDLGIETCFFNGLTAYGKAWLQFVFPYYIWAIAGLIIASSRYSIRVARITGYNSVPVLATLFLLSYAKLLRTIITVMSYTIVDYPQGSKAVWSADGNIDYLGPKHAPLFVVALATLLFLWLPNTLLLLLGQWLRQFDNRLLTRMLMKIKPFLDAYYGPLKDKHYYWFGALLFIRIVILLISSVLPANNFSVFTLSISVSAGALVVFTAIGPAVYRSKVTSVFETALFTNLALLGLAKFYVHIAGGNQAPFTYLLIGMAFAQFLGLVTYHVFSVLKPFFSKYHKRLINNNTDDEDKDDDEEREGVWRFETSLPLQEIPRRLATPYENVSTAVH